MKEKTDHCPTHTNTDGDDNGFNVPPRALPLGPFLTVGDAFLHRFGSNGQQRGGWLHFSPLPKMRAACAERVAKIGGKTEVPGGWGELEHGIATGMR